MRICHLQHSVLHEQGSHAHARLAVHARKHLNNAGLLSGDGRMQAGRSDGGLVPCCGQALYERDRAVRVRSAAVARLDGGRVPTVKTRPNQLRGCALRLPEGQRDLEWL